MKLSVIGYYIICILIIFNWIKIFTYVVIGLGFFLFLNGLIGWVGSIVQSVWLIRFVSISFQHQYHCQWSQWPKSNLRVSPFLYPNLYRSAVLSFSAHRWSASWLKSEVSSRSTLFRSRSVVADNAPTHNHATFIYSSSSSCIYITWNLTVFFFFFFFLLFCATRRQLVTRCCVLCCAPNCKLSTQWKNETKIDGRRCGTRLAGTESRHS